MTEVERLQEMMAEMRGCLRAPRCVLVLVDPKVRPRWSHMDPDWEWLNIHSYGL